MNKTFSEYGAATTKVNNTPSARTVVAEWYQDFGQFGDRIELYLSALAQVGATKVTTPLPTQPTAYEALIEAWASATENDATGAGTLLGRLRMPAAGLGALTGVDGLMLIDNPRGLKYVTLTARAGLANDGVTAVPLSYRGLVLAAEAPDGADYCNVTTTPLVKLRTGAKLLADKVNDDSVTDDTWDGWVNDGIESLWAIVTTYFADHMFSTVDFALAGGIGGNFYDTTTIPAKDFRRARLLERDPDTAQRRRVPGFNFNEKDDYAGQAAWNPRWATDVRKRLMGSKIYVEPYERAAGNYRLYYVPRHPRLVANCDALDPSIDQWAEYPKVFACMKALGVEETDDNPHAVRLAALKQEIAETAATRDDGQADTIADVEDMNGWNRSGW